MVPTDKTCTYCSMSKQYMKGLQNEKKVFLVMIKNEMVKAILALHFNGKAKDICTVQRTETKENEKGFLGLFSDCP